MPDTPSPDPAPVTIKKYANRRLYNTATSSYVTLDSLSKMVKSGTEFLVFDAKSGEDITRAVLTQIIVEEEAKGQNLLPISFLRQLIGFYGDNMQWLVPTYLETSMKAFAHNQTQMRQYLNEAFGGLFPFGSLEQMGKQNMAMLERAMRLFVPPGGDPESARAAFGKTFAGAPMMTGEGTESTKSAPASEPEAILELRKQLEALQRHVMELDRGKSKDDSSKP